MKIKYEIDDTLDIDEIVIKCKELNGSILDLQRMLNTNTVSSVFGVRDNKIYPLNPKMIERIYIQNRRTILFSRNEEYESKRTLSEFETTLNNDFVRISKSVIANTKHIKSIESEFSGNFTLVFLSNNTEILSRSYVKNLKSAIGLEG